MESTADDMQVLATRIRAWARELGFTGVGIADPDLRQDEYWLLRWLRRGWQGSMGWMGRHGVKRSRPQRLLPGTRRIISVRLDYQPTGAEPWSVLADGRKAYVARYALGRDYHKLMRQRLQRLARWIEAEVGPHGYRAFVDSAPVLEKAVGREANLGWIGKHTLLMDRDASSWFFLGELFTDLPLPADPPRRRGHCGRCRACIDICPTGAIVGPYQLDARRCISYLTIEHDGPIPEALRPLMGNRVFGCDDCQLVCPWNKFARPTAEKDFQPRHGLDQADLVALFGWTERQFLERMAGSAIRRLGHERWLRNLAVALGNGPASAEAVAALEARRGHPSPLVREHVAWALRRLTEGRER